MPAEQPATLVYDGVCGLCSRPARVVSRHDRQGRFRLVAMQSAEGEKLYRRFGIDPADPDTMILVEGGRALRDSEAVLAIWRELGFPWRAAAGVAGLIPTPVRDPLYRWIARNRYRLFGRRETCWLPEKAR